MTNKQELLQKCAIEEDEYIKVIDIDFLKNKKFYIPDYQRGYRWLDEARYFVKDVLECCDDEYLFQPIVVKKIETNKEYNQLLTHECPSKRNGIIDSDNSFELIDGQQRLTTLYLVLSILDSSTNFFDLYYESHRPVDNLYINFAKQKIGESLNDVNKEDFKNKLIKISRFVWYISEGNPKETFKDLNAGKTELTSAELFKAMLININNSEEDNLISYQFDEIENKLGEEDFWRFISDNKQVKNRIELLLDVYAYNLNKEIRGKNTINIRKYINVASYLNKNIHEPKFAFNSFSNFIEAVKDEKARNFDFYNTYHNYTNKQYWEEIYDMFEILKSWYSDYQTRNLIGYLFARKGISYKDKIELLSLLINKQKELKYEFFIKYIYKLILNDFVFNKEHKKKRYEINELDSISSCSVIENSNLLDSANDHFVYIDSKYSNKDKDEIDYKSNSKLCYNLLLLTNIYECVNNHTIFDFKLLKDKYNVKLTNKVIWDIEHINSKHLKTGLFEKKDDGSFVNTQETIVANLIPLKKELESKPKDSLINKKISIIEKIINLGIGDISNSDLNEIKIIWENYVSGKEENNSISNLALLSSDINRMYHDDFFNEKCIKMKKMDKEGRFIPSITKKIFIYNQFVLNKCDTNSYVCENTNDKVFLLSNKEAMTFFSDVTRQKNCTDYATAQGCYVAVNTKYVRNHKGFYLNSFWWLRSPYSNSSYYADYIYTGGYIYHYNVNRTCYGVVPALKIKL